MSLLLEALKKAERAKEEAQRRAREGEDGGEADTAEHKAVVTRDKLPDISPTLEIASEDLGPAPKAPASASAAERPVLELAPDPEPANPPPPRSAAPRPPTTSRSAASSSRPADEQTTRAAAKKVFEAKFREPNPKIPFYITLGALGAFAVGTVGYFWYQLRPPPSLVNLNPQRQAETTVAADAKSAPAPAPVAAVADNPLAGLPSTTPTRPAEPSPAPRSEPRQQAAATASPAPETPRLAAPRATARPAPASTGAEPERISTAPRTAPQVNPKVEGGYSAYQSGDLVTARSDYEQALRDEPANRDALLGLAALEVRSARYEAAEALYLRVLQTDPRDSQAQAALIALRSARADPLVTESRVKSLLALDPGAHALNFALGNQFAQQNRWAEAQQEYFKAYAAEPENADFAFNLAVSLDHLRQPKSALEYYRRAIALGEKRGASFDLPAARARAEQLAR